MEQEILKAIKEDRLYDFIANNYWKMEKEIARDLLLEIYYILRYEQTEISHGEDLCARIVESLKENRDWEE